MAPTKTERRLDVVDKQRWSPLALAPLQRCAVDETLHDYVLLPYVPTVPVAGKLRSVSLLVESFALAGLEEQGLALLAALERGLGRGRTVWGIKQRRGELLGWELYFYDYERRRADLSVARVRELLRPSVELDAVEPRVLPWHMFSVEVTPSALAERGPAGVQLYIDMRSYALQGELLELRNLYTFHDPKTGIDEVLHRLQSSVHFDARRHRLAELMSPSLRRCHRVCVSNKRHADAMYFSRITTSAAAAFCRQHGWPAALTRFVESGELDHLQWDVGVDFSSVDGALTIGKTGIYGSF